MGDISVPKINKITVYGLIILATNYDVVSNGTLINSSVYIYDCRDGTRILVLSHIPICNVDSC